MLSRTLISRPNVEKLVRMADLDLKNQSKAQHEALIETLMKTVTITSTGRDNLYSVGYRDTERARPSGSIQAMVSIFVESGLGASRKDADSAKVFLNEQIKAYEAKLEEAEARLKEFRLRNLDLQVGDGKDTASRLGEMQRHSSRRPRLELREAENARDAAKAALAGEKLAELEPVECRACCKNRRSAWRRPRSMPRIDAQKPPARQPAAALHRAASRRAQRAPSGAGPRRIRSARRCRRCGRQRWRPRLRSPSAAATTAWPAQELNRMVAMAEVQVASLRARVGEYSARLRTGARGAAEVRTRRLEAEAGQLNRDYAIHKKNYEDLVARRESAAMSGDLDVASGMADFRLDRSAARIAQAGVPEPPAFVAPGAAWRPWRPVCSPRLRAASCVPSSSIPMSCAPNSICRSWAWFRRWLATATSGATAPIGCGLSPHPAASCCCLPPAWRP